MRFIRVSIVLAAVVAAASVTGNGAAGQSSGTGGYCVEANSHYDPRDVPEGGAALERLPKGFVRREIEVAGLKTRVIEGGRRRSKRAFVLVHGSPGSGQDWIGLMKAAARTTRVIAFDVPGFGHASKPRGRAYTLDNGMVFFEALLRRLGVRRALTLGHDIGASTAIEWAARHPKRSDGVVIMSGGIAPGYEWHTFAQVWRQEGAGEAFMLQLTRRSWHMGLQRGQPKPLPAEFIDRLYDDYDRMTRCATLDIYRAVDEPGVIGMRQAKMLRRHDLPALVIWGRHDPYIGPEFAEKQRQGFPHARIHIFEEAAHWPFIDEPGRTAKLVGRFVCRHQAVRRCKPAGRRN